MISGIIIVIIALYAWGQPLLTPAPRADCVVPDFAIAMGHAEVWKEHNNCQ
jgi:hypothetical protein